MSAACVSARVLINTAALARWKTARLRPSAVSTASRLSDKPLKRFIVSPSASHRAKATVLMRAVGECKIFRPAVPGPALANVSRSCSGLRRVVVGVVYSSAVMLALRLGAAEPEPNPAALLQDL